MIWAKNMKQVFTKVIWTDKTRVSLDGPDNWSSDWVRKERKSDSKGNGELWYGVQCVGCNVWGDFYYFIGPFREPEDVKINRYTY